MSSDIYARPDFTKVRYNRKVQEDKEDWQEMEVDIYESADSNGGDHTEFQSHQGGLHTEKHPAAVQTRLLTAAVFCLGVLCFLTLTGVIVLSIHYISVTLEKDQQQARYNTLNNTYSQLLGHISDMAVNNSQLQDEVKQLKSNTEDMAVNNSQLQDEVKQLKSKTEGKCCPEGWKRFGCSCYFKSSEKKTWYESRNDCQNKGADLVIINNKEEQNFVIGLNMHGESWIGLQAIKEIWKNSRWEWEWEWVDKSPLTENFWAAGSLLNARYQYRAAYCDQQGQWIQSKTSYYKNWICEK